MQKEPVNGTDLNKRRGDVPQIDVENPDEEMSRFGAFSALPAVLAINLAIGIVAALAWWAPIALPFIAAVAIGWILGFWFRGAGRDMEGY